MCLNPIVIKNERYYKGELTPFGSHIPVPCGQCVQCKEKKRTQKQQQQQQQQEPNKE